MNILTYDVECYPNIFTLAAKHKATGQRVLFELSERRNDFEALIAFLQQCRQLRVTMQGFNNLAYDYMLLHFIMKNYPRVSYQSIYEHNAAYFACPRGQQQRQFGIWPSDILIPQLDLFKMHHFDRILPDQQDESVSLKSLMFKMRSWNLQDLPFPPGQPIPVEYFPALIDYNHNDVDETERFGDLSADDIQMRLDLNPDWLNYSEAKIGEQVFIEELEKLRPGCCAKGAGTPRDSIALADLILPYINLESPEFQRILDYFKAQVITETKGTFKGLECTIDGFTYVFGLGGIHASVHSQTMRANDEYAIVDYDVEAYYPSLAIANNLAPAHLGDAFPKVAQALKEKRKVFAKGTAENKAMKLANNGAWGKTNSKWSRLLDPAYTMQVTINGQLSLCMLAEQLTKIPDCTMIQANTDGLTVRIPRKYCDGADSIVKWWEGLTGLTMERNEYSLMAIRDVNNYIAVSPDGSVKRKGAYGYGSDLNWKKDHSKQIVAIAAEQAIVYGRDITRTILSHEDKMDFLCCAKVPKSSKLLWGDEQIQNTSRYLVTNSGQQLTKQMPPLKGKTEPRNIGICKGWNTTIWNNLEGFHTVSDLDINYLYYVEEARKLVEVLR